MDWVAHLVYGALVWREKRHASAAYRGDGDGEHPGTARHLKVGARGETLAYWHLRHAGYAIVARNRRPRSRSGELDLVGWDGPVLAFIEVKTRTGDDAGPPEMALSLDQQRRIANSATVYMRRLKKQPAAYRFDVASVMWNPAAGYRVRVIKDAFRV
ncbi:MAG TPA: YraN family protein [Terriglobia bacterium]|nr:YraN family protein [Terriglobia bacterium]